MVMVVLVVVVVVVLVSSAWTLLVISGVISTLTWL